jgi:hypothetical protein
MNENRGYLLRDYFEFWGEYLEVSRDAIKAKMFSQYDANMADFLVLLFIDCTIIPSCRTGGGPMVPGVQAARYPYLVQEAMYNG